MPTDKKVFDISPAPKAKAAVPKADDKPIAKPAVSSDSSDSFSIPVRSGLVTPTAVDADDQASVAEESTPKVEVHRELSITPSAEILKEVEEAEAPAANTEQSSTSVAADEPKTADASSAPKAEDTKESTPDEPVSITPALQSAPEPAPNPPPASTTPGQVLGDGKTAEEMESPKVFDTKQYNLPIAQHTSHNAGRHMLGFFLVFVVLALLGAVAAIDAGFVDAGFDLPFNLINN